MFDDDLDNDSEEFGKSKEMSDEEQGDLWEQIYPKVSAAIPFNHSFAIIFNMIPNDVDPDEGSSAIIERSQFEPLLNNYLKWCESKEMFERCAEIKKLLTKFKDQN